MEAFSWVKLEAASALAEIRKRMAASNSSRILAHTLAATLVVDCTWLALKVASAIVSVL